MHNGAVLASTNQLYFIPLECLLHNPAKVTYHFYVIISVNCFLKFQHMNAITTLTKCYEVILAHMAVSSSEPEA